jgi:hypothetical protein
LVDVLLCRPLIGCRENAQEFTQAASGMILQNHGQLSVRIFSDKITPSGSLKRVTGRILKISYFKGASKTFKFFFHQLGNK